MNDDNVLGGSSSGEREVLMVVIENLRRVGPQGGCDVLMG